MYSYVRSIPHVYIFGNDQLCYKISRTLAILRIGGLYFGLILTILKGATKLALAMLENLALYYPHIKVKRSKLKI